MATEKARFLDANIFIYAYYKPKRRLSQNEDAMKDQAKSIIHGMNAGEELVRTTVVHIAEAANILKHGMPVKELNDLILGLFMLDNVEVIGVKKELYFTAAELGRELKLDPNDALAIEVMRANGITEIYSFDHDFDRIEGITRIPAS